MYPGRFWLFSVVGNGGAQQSPLHPRTNGHSSTGKWGFRPATGGSLFAVAVEGRHFDIRQTPRINGIKLFQSLAAAESHKHSRLRPQGKARQGGDRR
ncbi:unnamed protein product [Blepharisma stoltei]|uniref:Uncharacterized protein n=1 Tax=Blepharisma stoltei TaxID=1481888 RepID=A0AAU9JMP6_9CILI|nr:unnamed protein product [Blepharisma stoltei]